MTVIFKKIVLATKNKNKVLEIKELFKDSGINIVEIEGEFDPEENGSTFEENAYIKALSAAKLTNLPAIADDSGLEVEALNGRPGIHSSRYAEDDKSRISKLLRELKECNATDRSARFVCAMVLTLPDGEILHTSIGKCEGVIVDESVGANGFGYDPVFYIPQSGKTLAQLTLEEKNKLSHRAKALNDMVNWLKTSKNMCAKIK